MEELFSKSAAQFVTKSEFVVQSIRRMVYEGELKPGDRVVVGRIARHLGVSDTPVREAVKQLVSSGFLEASAHVGAVVPGFTLEEVKELFHMRAVLAGLAVRLNMPYYTGEVIARMDRVLESGALAVAAGDHEQYVAINHSFHLSLMETGHFRNLYGAYVGLMRQTERFRAGLGGYRWDIGRSQAVHVEIRNLLARGQFEAAASLIEQHEIGSMQPLVDFVQRHGEERRGRAPG